MCVFVRCTLAIRCVPNSSPPVWSSDTQWGGGSVEAAVLWPSLCCDDDDVVLSCPPSECAGHGNMEQQRGKRERAKGDCNRTGMTAEN